MQHANVRDCSLQLVLNSYSKPEILHVPLTSLCNLGAGCVSVIGKEPKLVRQLGAPQGHCHLDMLSFSA